MLDFLRDALASLGGSWSGPALVCSWGVPFLSRWQLAASLGVPRRLRALGWPACGSVPLLLSVLFECCVVRVVMIAPAQLPFGLLCLVVECATGAMGSVA